MRTVAIILLRVGMAITGLLLLACWTVWVGRVPYTATLMPFGWFIIPFALIYALAALIWLHQRVVRVGAA